MAKAFLSRRALAILRTMVECADTARGLDDDYEPEITREGRSCWFGMERIHTRTLDALLYCMAVSRTDDSRDGYERFTLNSTGRQIAARPALAGEVFAALGGGPFTVIDGQVAPIGTPPVVGGGDG